VQDVTWFPVAGKTFIVLGLARSGMSAVKWLLAHDAFVIAIDDDKEKEAEARKLGATTKDTFDSIGWEEVSALVQSPGVPLWFPTPHPLTQEARDKGIPIISDVDLFRLSHPQSHFVGITGTNGKSTTTALIGYILRECGIECLVGGNIGTPVLDLPHAPLYILELSSYQLDLTDGLDLHVVGWLNITPDHLDRHGSLEGYVAAKKRIFKTSGTSQIAVIGIDDTPSEMIWAEMTSCQTTIPVSINRNLNEGLHIFEGCLMDGPDKVMDVTNLPTLKGVHNFQNVAIAYGVCCALNLPKADIVKAIQTFPGLAHRQEKVRTLKGIQFINDSKGTNADATAKALAVFDHIYWIAGGKAKSDGIGSLSTYFPKIVHTFLIGEAQNSFAETLEGKVPYTKSGTLEQAVKESFHKAREDNLSSSVVLLSPACASFDQFQDFEHRGKMFCQFVNSLEE